MTKTELIEQLGTSRGTLYRHMAKLGIDKGKNLSKEDIERITFSIKGSTNVSQYKTEQNPIQEQLENENNKLRESVKELKEKVIVLERDNRNLIQELSNSLAMHNEVNKQYSNFMIEMKGLMAPEKEVVEKNNIEENSVVEKKDAGSDLEEKKKKWWKR